MTVNNLSSEALLARFFDDELLGDYCRDRLGKSDKGNSATLAARIAREWAKPKTTTLRASGRVRRGSKILSLFRSSHSMSAW